MSDNRDRLAEEVAQHFSKFWRAYTPEARAEAIREARTFLDRSVALDALITEAITEGRESVGLADFMPDPCGEETRVVYDVHEGNVWITCSLRRGHDGDHEDEHHGTTWADR